MAFAAGPIAHPALKISPIGAVELVWLASPAVASAFAGGEAVLPVWSLASHSPIHGRMREALAASRIAQNSLNLCTRARPMIHIAKAGGGISWEAPVGREEAEHTLRPQLSPYA